MLPLIIGGAAVLGIGGFLLFERSKNSTPAPGTLTPQRQDILTNALATNNDPAQLNTLANAFQDQGLPAQAAQLAQKAAAVTPTSAPATTGLTPAQAAEAAATAQAQSDAASQQIAAAAAATQHANDLATAQRAQDAAAQNQAAADAAAKADQDAQAAAAAQALQAQQDSSIVDNVTDAVQSVIDPSSQLMQVTAPKVSIQEQLNSATESGGGILRAVVGNIPSIQMVLNGVLGINLDVDGVKGPQTTAAVKQFQSGHGLTADGDPGPQTVAALNQVAFNA